MKKLTIIVPVEKYGAAEKTLLKKAISSINVEDIDYEVAIVGPKSIMKGIKKDYPNARIIENEGSTDVCSQINLAVDTAGEYFSVLEIDDWYSSTWFKNVMDHINNETESISLYLPLTEIVDFNKPDDGSVYYINEAVLASSFSDRLGFIDLHCIEDYFNFNLTGGVFNTADFIEVGKLKPSIKLTFWYEYLLRATQFAKVTYVIPKVGYFHTIGRADCLMSRYKNEMDQDEADWWVELARKEYFFKNDRQKTYEG